jgi:hypothetical protein
MRLRLIALGCSLTGALGFLTLPPATAVAENTVLTGSTVVAGNTVLTENTGPSGNSPNPASRTLQAYARVASRLTGNYKKSRSRSGIVYDVYHGTGTLTLYSTVVPNKHGECLEPESQQYDRGAGWHADTKYGCDTLDGASHDAAPFSLSQAIGARYRIRGDYFRNSSDTRSLSRQGPWLYFIVMR